jgi:hypothetical protein
MHNARSMIGIFSSSWQQSTGQQFNTVGVFAAYTWFCNEAGHLLDWFLSAV